MRSLGVVSLAIVLVACGGTTVKSSEPNDRGDDAGGGKCRDGVETCRCYGNGTCNAGLTCASNLCVRFGAGGADSGVGANGGTGGRRSETGGTPSSGGTSSSSVDGGDAAATGVDAGEETDGNGVSEAGTGGSGGSETGPGCVAQVSAGADQTCARKTDGSLWCWGSTNLGEIGAGRATGYSLEPVEVTTLGHDVADVVAGVGHTCARKTDGTLWCWGMNFMGAVGDGTHDGVTCGGSLLCRATPKQVTGTIGEHAAQFGLTDWSTCACGTDKSLWCWGHATWGELGGTTTGTMCGSNLCEPAPIQVTALGKSAVQVTGGETTACARLADGTVSCWGNQVSNGTLYGTPNPTAVPALTNIVQIAAGPSHFVALDGEGSMYHFSWGVTPSKDGTSLGGIVEVGAGGPDTSCARLEDGSVWCWGSNAYGQLGDGTEMGSPDPVKVVGLPAKAVQISVGGGDRGHSCALLADGSTWCWGRNDFGQLGDGTADRRLGPVQAKLCPLTG